MGVSIQWHSPVSTVTGVQISKSDSYYGAYTVLGTTAGSDSTYTDSTGTRDNWYKIRFYQYNVGTAWSSYSEPISSAEEINLCNVTDVKNTIETTGRWTDDEIYDALVDVDEMIYSEFGRPLMATKTNIGSIGGTLQRIYYVGEENIQKIDRVFYGTTSKVEFKEGDDFDSSNDHGMIRIYTDASTGVTLSTDCELDIHYAPKLFNKLAIYRTCRKLLDKTDYSRDGKVSKEVELIEKRIREIETVLANRYVFAVSSQFIGYDQYYGVNSKRIEQDFYRNNMVSNGAF